LISVDSVHVCTIGLKFEVYHHEQVAAGVDVGGLCDPGADPGGCRG